MHLEKNIVEGIIVYLIFDVIILRLIFSTFLKRQADRGKGSRYLVGVSLIFLGVILTSLGVFFAIPYGGWNILNSAAIAAVVPFLVVGVPCLALGILLVNNPLINLYPAWLAKAIPDQSSQMRFGWRLSFIQNWYFNPKRNDVHYHIRIPGIGLFSFIKVIPLDIL
jgi:hypothetical protein